MNKSTLFLAIATTFAAVAHAQEQAAPFPLTANISLTSNYKYRGQDQGNNKPAVQGGFDWSANGFYIGNWNSSIGFTNSGLEMDFYGGYKGEITKDLTFDVGVLQYYYPQKNREFNGVPNYNTTEVYGALSFGPATLKYSHTVSKDYFGFGSVAQTQTYSGRNTGYLDLSANFPVVEGLTINTHVGYTRFASELKDNVGLPNYYDYKLGVTYDLSKFAGSGVTISGAIIGANKKDFYGDINKARFIATLTKAL
ncbi:MAG: hypothetical protein H7Y61_13745 [Rhizobiales bacterium]|nr:hypothetical protein [Rhizobacter sp.]